MADNLHERQLAARKRLAHNLRLFRGKIGVSQETLADLAGLHRTQISQLERGLASVMLDTLVALAMALGVEQHELLVEHAETPTPIKVGRKKDSSNE